MLNKQKGFIEILIIMGMLMGLGLFLMYNAYAISKMASINKPALEKEGYTLIKEYGGFSTKEYPDTSICQDNEFIFLNSAYNEVDDLSKATKVMCVLKEKD